LDDTFVRGEQRSLDASAVDAIPVVAMIRGGLITSRSVVAGVSLSIAIANFASSGLIGACVSCNINAAVSDESGGSETTLDGRARVHRLAGTAGRIAETAARRATGVLVDEADAR
jgi:hypothetical protein